MENAKVEDAIIELPHAAILGLLFLQGNGIPLSQRVIASGAQQSLVSAEIAASLMLLAMTDIP
jgi:hypothetical protein